MRMRGTIGGTLLAGSVLLGGCAGPVTYASKPDFDYRVANLHEILVSAQPDAQGRTTITLPARTTAAGFWTTRQGSGDVKFTLEGESGEHSTPVPAPDSSGQSFVGILAFKPITSITVPGPVRGLEVDSPR